MATSSHLLVPQALHMIPRIPTKNLGVSSFIPSVNSRISVSRVSLKHSISNFGFAMDSRKRREFVAKAEESTEGEDTEAVSEDVAETVEATEVEEDKPPWKPRTKLGDVMGILNQKAIEVSEKVRPVPEIRTGDIVEIKLAIPENRRRLSIYKGIVMSRQNAGIHTTIRIRRIIAGIGVEIVFPMQVKTTSPKKYFVRPNTGVIQPWDSCIIRVTLQAQREYPPDMQCKDKFLLQSTLVPPHTDVDDLPQDTFTKDSGKTLTECKLKVSYISSSTTQRSSESGATNGDGNGSETISRLKEERDAAVKQTQQLQHELEMVKKRRMNSGNGLSLKLAALVGLIGLIIGFILKLTLASPT
ncbi:hypothetical protein F2Q70_00031536 [Brassica cretica]|uniref:MSP domain-containing protein n=1 Tax=Brassica cretica TaxID=69181 RepID=A0A8S9FBT4_BRACR|nr:hypothetical protein F2Q70_00031536 [Brassica cretica]